MTDVADGFVGGHERLRSLVALAHCVPGVRLALRCRHGGRILVGDGAGTDVDTATMGRVVVASADPRRHVAECLVHDVEVLGSVTEGGGGLLRGTHPEIETRWFVTSVEVAPLDRLLRERTDAVLGVVVQLSCDPVVGRSVVGVGIDRADRAAELDEVATAVATECLVQEIAAAARTRRRAVG